VILQVASSAQSAIQRSLKCYFLFLRACLCEGVSWTHQAMWKYHKAGK